MALIFWLNSADEISDDGFHIHYTMAVMGKVMGVYLECRLKSRDTRLLQLDSSRVTLGFHHESPSQVLTLDLTQVKSRTQ